MWPSVKMESMASQLASVSSSASPRSALHKKTIVIVMNCAGDELGRYLNSSELISQNYVIKYFPIYGGMPDACKDEIYAGLAAADVAITQNVRYAEWMQNKSLRQAANSKCRFFSFVFWRFDGLWPIKQERFAGAFWYLPNESPKIKTYEDFVSFDVGRVDILTNFERELEKFYDIDQASDFSMFPFLMANLRQFNMVSDHWHPSSMFFFAVAKHVIEELCGASDIKLLANDNINRNRHRLVLDCIYRELNIHYAFDLILFNRKTITREVFFYFSKYAEMHLSRAEAHPEAAEALFNRWVEDMALPEIDYDLMRSASISLDHLGVRRADQADAVDRCNDPDQQTSSARASQWTFDLRDFRTITSIVGRNICGMGPESSPFEQISLSVDGEMWQTVSEIAPECFAPSGGSDFHLEIKDGALAKFVRVSTDDSNFSLRRDFSVFSKVVVMK